MNRTLVKITKNSDIYRFSGESCEATMSTDTGEQTYRGKLLNTLSIEEKARVDDSGSPATSQSILVDMTGMWDTDPDTFMTGLQLWGATVEIEIYQDASMFAQWNGILTAWSVDAEYKMTIQATSQSIDVLKMQIPDEVVRLVEFTDAGRSASNVTIPIVVGGTDDDPVYVQGVRVFQHEGAPHDESRYIFSSGPVEDIVVMKANGVAITSWTQWANGTYDQGLYPGFAYAQFDGAIKVDGVWPELIAGIKGILYPGDGTAATNASKVISNILTMPNTQGEAGPDQGGYGLGEAFSKIDTASFDQAEIDCNTEEFYVAGVISERRTAAFWLTELTKACRGTLKKKAGKWYLTIDKVRDPVYSYTQANMRMINYGSGDLTQRYNDVIVQYRLDPFTGTYLGWQQKQDQASINEIGRNTLTTELLLVRDHATASKIADYLLNIEKYGENYIEFETAEFSSVSEDDIINVGMGKFKVKTITKGKHTAIINARSWSDDIFTTTTPDTYNDPAIDPY